MPQSSLSRLYFESVRVSKVPVIWFVGAILLHLGLFCLPVGNHRPSRQEIVFYQGDAGIQIELLPPESAPVASNQPVVIPNVPPPPVEHVPLATDAFADPVSTVAESKEKASSNLASTHSNHARQKGATDRTSPGAPRAGTAIAQPASQVYTTQPPYPPEARELGIEGAVRLRVRVGIDGCPRAVQITRSSGRSDFDLASLTTVRRQWRFRPARTADGTAVESTILVAIQFVLKS